MPSIFDNSVSILSVFIQNKAGRDDFSLESYESMQKTLEAIFNGSRLKISGKASLLWY